MASFGCIQQIWEWPSQYRLLYIFSSVVLCLESYPLINESCPLLIVILYTMCIPLMGKNKLSQLSNTRPLVFTVSGCAFPNMWNWYSLSPVRSLRNYLASCTFLHVSFSFINTTWMDDFEFTKTTAFKNYVGFQRSCCIANLIASSTSESKFDLFWSSTNSERIMTNKFLL